MSITTYTELQTAVANWTNRTDLTSRIPEFIALAEAKIRRTLRTMGEEKSAFASTVAGEERVALPVDFNGMRTVFTRGNPKQQLTQVSLDKLRRTYASNATGKPLLFAIADDQFYLGFIPDAVYDLELNYFAFEALSGSVATNNVLTNHPDVYLTGSLAEAHHYLMDRESWKEWTALYESAVMSVFADERRRRHGGQLRTAVQVSA